MFIFTDVYILNWGRTAFPDWLLWKTAGTQDHWFGPIVLNKGQLKTYTYKMTHPRSQNSMSSTAKIKTSTSKSWFRVSLTMLPHQNNNHNPTQIYQNQKNKNKNICFRIRDLYGPLSMVLISSPRIHPIKKSFHRSNSTA